jgi:hypothetical protein
MTETFVQERRESMKNKCISARDYHKSKEYET